MNLAVLFISLVVIDTPNPADRKGSEQKQETDHAEGDQQPVQRGQWRYQHPDNDGWDQR